MLGRVWVDETLAPAIFVRLPGQRVVLLAVDGADAVPGGCAVAEKDKGFVAEGILIDLMANLYWEGEKGWNRLHYVKTDGYGGHEEGQSGVRLLLSTSNLLNSSLFHRLEQLVLDQVRPYAC